MMDDMPCGNGSLKSTAVRIQHHVSHQAQNSSQLTLKSSTDVCKNSLPPTFEYLIQRILNGLQQLHIVLRIELHYTQAVRIRTATTDWVDSSPVHTLTCCIMVGPTQFVICQPVGIGRVG